MHSYFPNSDYANLILNCLMLVWGGFQMKGAGRTTPEQTGHYTIMPRNFQIRNIFIDIHAW